MSERRIRALGLLSGGLDSTLATRLVADEGVDVLGLHFSTGFCVADRHRLIGNVNNPARPYRNDALHAGAKLEVPIEIVDIRDQPGDEEATGARDDVGRLTCEMGGAGWRATARGIESGRGG